MRKDYAKKKTFDGSRGQCCLSVENPEGAKIIQYFDSFFILLLNLRAIFAVWSLVDDDKVEIYSRVRLITFWIQWVFLFLCIVGFAFYIVF